MACQILATQKAAPGEDLFRQRRFFGINWSFAFFEKQETKPLMNADKRRFFGKISACICVYLRFQQARVKIGESPVIKINLIRALW